MGDAPGERADAFHSLRAQELGFETLLIADVADDGGEELVSVFVDLRNRRLDRELLAVGPQTEKRARLSHRPLRHVRFAEDADVLAMRRAEPPRDKAVQALSQGLGRRAAEHLLSRRVEKHDALILIDGNDRVHRRGKNAGELGLAQSQRGGDLRLMLIICDRRFLGFHNSSRSYRVQSSRRSLHVALRRPETMKTRSSYSTLSIWSSLPAA